MQFLQPFVLTNNGNFDSSWSNRAVAVHTASQRDIQTRDWEINGDPISREELLVAQLKYGIPESTARVPA
jgi:hypothetical protein